MPKRKRKMMPEFSNEDEEREFWERVEVTEFLEDLADDIALDLKGKGRKGTEWIKVTLRLEADSVAQLKGEQKSFQF